MSLSFIGTTSDDLTHALSEHVRCQAQAIVELCFQINKETGGQLELDQLTRLIGQQVSKTYNLALPASDVIDILDLGIEEATKRVSETITMSHTPERVSMEQIEPAVENQPPKIHESSSYLGIPGVQVINARHLHVDMLHLKIAERDLQEGRPSVTPDAPIEVDFHIQKKTFRLKDGYHRYLDKRGGTLAAALAQSKAGVFPDFAVNVSLVKSVPKGAFGAFDEPLSDVEIQSYLNDLLGQSQRITRAKEQGFDTESIWYHGSIPDIGSVGSDITAFAQEKVGNNYWQDKQGFFFINDPSVASNYASHNSIGRTVPGGSVYPVYLASERVFVVDDSVAKQNGWAKPSVDDVISVWDNHYQEIIAKAGDVDAIEIKDKISRQSMRVVFNPANIRSIHASFLPEHRDRHDLLGHHFTPTLPKVHIFPAGLFQIANLTSGVLHDNPEDSAVNITKKLLTLLKGGTWADADKLALLSAVQERNTNSQTPEMRAKAIVLTMREVLQRYPESALLINEQSATQSQYNSKKPTI